MARGDTIVADEASNLRFELQDEHIDAKSGKPVGDTLVYQYENGDDVYRVSFHRQKTIVDRQLIGELSGIKHVLARLAHFDGAYLRFTGDVQLEHIIAGDKVEDVRDAGIWELMYFGHTR